MRLEQKTRRNDAQSRTLRARNRAMFAILAGAVVLIFFLTIVKVGH